MSGAQDFGSRTEVYESPIYGRVLEIALTGSQSQVVSSRGREIIKEEVARHRPQYLVLNLLGFDSVFGNDLIGALASGALAMRELGGGGKTGILAKGRTAATLKRVLPLMKIEFLFGGRIHSDLESALSNLRSTPALAKCELQIVFNKPGCTYAVGEKVRGVVQVRAGEELACQKLTLSRRWVFTNDRGGRKSGPEYERELFAGTWQASEVASYRFEFIAPAGPITYRGLLLNVEWKVYACAELSARFDVNAAKEFTLVAGDPKRVPTQEPLWTRKEPLQTDKPARPTDLSPSDVGIILGLIGSLFLFFGLALLRHDWTKLYSRPEGGSLVSAVVIILVYGGLMAVGGAFIGVGIGFFTGRWPRRTRHTQKDTTGGYDLGPSYRPPVGALLFGAFVGDRLEFVGLRALLAERKLGRVDVLLSSTTLRPGQTITCTARFQPRARTEVTEATATLKATEKLTWRGGRNPGSYSHVVHETQVPLTEGQLLMPGVPVQLQASLTIPSRAPCTFMAPNNELQWAVHVHLQLTGWAHWIREFPITVHP